MTEFELILERARATGAYPVVKWLLNSYLPWKQEKVKEKKGD